MFITKHLEFSKFNLYIPYEIVSIATLVDSSLNQICITRNLKFQFELIDIYNKQKLYAR